MLCALPRSKLLRFRFSTKGIDLAGPAFCALPRSEELRQPGAWRAHCPRCAVGLITSLVPVARFTGCATRVPSQCAVCLLWGADIRLQSSWQMSTVQYPRKMWLATGSLFPVWWRMPSLGPKLPLAFHLWLSPACLSASSGGEEPVSSLLALFWHSLNPLFCEPARMWLRLELFFLSLSLFFPLSVCPTVWVSISR